MNSDEPSSIVSVLTRIFWMMIGPATLLLIALSIATSGGGWLGPKGVGYLVVLAALVGARWMEFRTGQPQTAMGTPAKPEDLPRYVLAALAAGFAMWALASLVGGGSAPQVGPTGAALPNRSAAVRSS